MAPSSLVPAQGSCARNDDGSVPLLLVAARMVPDYWRLTE